MKLYDRTDALLTRGVVALVGLGLPIAVLVVPLGTWLTGGVLRWTIDAPDATSVSAGLDTGDGVAVRAGDELLVRITDAGAGPWLATLAPGVVLSTAALVIAWQLLRLLHRIEARRPFAESSATALRVIAWTTFTATVLLAVATGFADSVVSEQALPGGEVSLGLELSFVPLVTAMLLLALAEAFSHGARLEAEVEGLV